MNYPGPKAPGARTQAQAPGARTQAQGVPLVKKVPGAGAQDV